MCIYIQIDIYEKHFSIFNLLYESTERKWSYKISGMWNNYKIINEINRDNTNIEQVGSRILLRGRGAFLTERLNRFWLIIQIMNTSESWISWGEKKIYISYWFAMEYPIYVIIYKTYHISLHWGHRWKMVNEYCQFRVYKISLWTRVTKQMLWYLIYERNLMMIFANLTVMLKVFLLLKITS